MLGVLIGMFMMPAVGQEIGQRMSVGVNSQKNFETYSLDKKLALLNEKLDYLIQKSLPRGYYVDDEGVVRSSIRDGGSIHAGAGSSFIGH